jgi:hypothetical protein
MAHSTSTQTVELNTTLAHTGDLYGDASEGCQHCDADDYIMVEINGRAGSRKRVQACWDCAQDYREAPDGLYDPTALGYTDGANYDGF